MAGSEVNGAVGLGVEDGGIEGDAGRVGGIGNGLAETAGAGVGLGGDGQLRREDGGGGVVRDGVLGIGRDLKADGGIGILDAGGGTGAEFGITRGVDEVNGAVVEEKSLEGEAVAVVSEMAHFIPLKNMNSDLRKKGEVA